jgi:hypothetical protein
VISRALRAGAAAIAVAALIDPAITVTARARALVSIVDAGSSDRAARDHVFRAVDAAMRHDFTVVDGSDPAADHTIAIGDRYPDRPIAGPVSTVTIAPARPAGVRIVGIEAPHQVPLATVVHVAVDLEATGVRGASSTLVVSAAGVEVGRSTHSWTKPVEHWHAELDVAPAGKPPFVLSARVTDPKKSGSDDRADTLVAVRSEPLRVLVYEPRPSWASSFVRRALEADSRFHVAGLTLASRNVPVKTDAPAALRAALPSAFDVVIVGGLDRLSVSDGDWLQRFTRERGGAALFVPDSLVDARLPDGVVGEEILLERHASLSAQGPLPRIDAAEITALSNLPPGATVLARVEPLGKPVIVSFPRGDGQVLIAGALDAWRYRAEQGVEFDRFWQSLVAGVALAARRDVDVEVVPALVAPGETATVTVRVGRQSIVAPVTASLEGGDPIRLWPNATPGVFTGHVTAPPTGGPRDIRVSVGVDDALTARATFAVGDYAAPRRTNEAPLRLLADAHGGIDVDSAHLDRLRQFIASHVLTGDAKTTVHPMRSVWWFGPFAGCLAIEWWIRRRRGLR